LSLSAPAGANSERSARNCAVLIVVVLTLIRLGLASSLELEGDEAYFWRWSHHLNWCYFSKGPGIALLIRCGTWLLGTNPLGVRLGAVLTSAAASLSLFALGRALLDARAGLWAVIIANTTPLWSAGSLLATADMPSVFLWTLAALCFWRLRDSRSVGAWLALGILLGIGTLMRFVVAFEPLVFALFLATAPAGRRRLRGAGFWLMLAAFALTLTPWLLCEREHAWVSGSQLIHRGGFDQPWAFHPLALAEFLALQFLVVAPYGVAAIAAYRRRERAGLEAEVARYLMALSLPLLALYTLLALNRPGQPNWTGPAYVAVTLVVVGAFARAGRSLAIRRLALVTLVLGFVLTFTLHLLLWGVRLPPGRDPFERLRGHRDLAEQVARISTATGSAFVIGDHYQVASLLSFYLPGQPDVYTPCVTPPANQFDLWSGYGAPYRGRDALYVSKSPEIPAILLQQFARVEPLAPVRTHWQGGVVGRYYVARCRQLISVCVAR
jgi:4-amino-4-deoxy-L-arabinose transferase-like glycosyltransferase